MLKRLAWSNLILLLVHIFFSYSTQVKLINTMDMKEVSDAYPSSFTPAGFTFSIWWLIYTSLIAFCIRHLILAYKQSIDHPGNQQLIAIGPWFIINNILTIGWLFSFTNQQILISTVLILAQFFSLFIIHFKLCIHQVGTSNGSMLLTQFPLSLYLGWILIASIANTAILFVSFGKPTAGLAITQESFTRILIITATVIVLLMVFVRKNPVVGIVATWALFGITYELRDKGFETISPLVITSSLCLCFCALASLVQALMNLLQRRRMSTSYSFDTNQQK